MPTASSPSEPSPKRTRVGFFGGSFDPPHNGHVAIARAAARESALDRVLFVPTARQPLKADGASAPYADRLGMVQALCATSSEFTASNIEAPRPDGQPNFTIDTLHRLQSQSPHIDLSVIVGIDAFLDLRRWRDPDALLSAAHWIVVSRPGLPIARLDELALTPAQRERVQVIDGVAEEVSGTAVRDHLLRGEDCTQFLPGPVLAYIREHGLYGGAESPRGGGSAREPLG